MSDWPTRRTMLAGGLAGLGTAIIPFPEWFDRYGRADAETPRVRYAAQTPTGQAMIASYRTAVAAMSARPQGDPCSWLFQWYTHQIRADENKAAIIPTLPVGQQPLANEMWNTCQAHYGRPLEFFLPWHRMYVYFFERIVRAQSGDPTFTLPYWDYMEVAQRALPAPFRGSSSVPLFRPDRRSPANTGQRVDINNTLALNLNCMNDGDYATFNSDIANNPHGQIHVMVGNTLGMGSVPWAANDPIFWLHHCNIDRIWSGWNGNGYTNPATPAWLNQTFVFADENGHRVQAKVSDFQAIAPLGYSYDQPVGFRRLPPFDLSKILVLAQVRRPIRGPGPGPDPVRIPLDRAGVTLRLDVTERGQPMLRSLKARTAAANLRLVIRDLRADVAPGVLYNVYLNLPTGLPDAEATRYFAGAINFFGAVASEHEAMADMPGMRDMPMAGPTFTLDVTALVQRLGPGSAFDVTIRPSGTPAAKAGASIGDVALVAG